jgi:hypothetical protein
MITAIINNLYDIFIGDSENINNSVNNSVNNSINNLSLNEQEYNPGTILKEKNNTQEYILLGYDHTRENLICAVSNTNILNNNIYVINKNNIDKIIKKNKLQANTKFFFE